MKKLNAYKVGSGYLKRRTLSNILFFISIWSSDDFPKYKLSVSPFSFLIICVCFLFVHFVFLFHLKFSGKILEIFLESNTPFVQLVNDFRQQHWKPVMPLSPFQLKNRSNVLFIKRASYSPTGQYSSVGSIDANFVTQFRIRLPSSVPLVSTILRLIFKQLRIYIIRYNINYIENRVLIYLR